MRGQSPPVVSQQALSEERKFSETFSGSYMYLHILHKWVICDRGGRSPYFSNAIEFFFDREQFFATPPPPARRHACAGTTQSFIPPSRIPNSAMSEADDVAASVGSNKRSRLNIAKNG